MIIKIDIKDATLVKKLLKENNISFDEYSSSIAAFYLEVAKMNIENYCIYNDVPKITMDILLEKSYKLVNKMLASDDCLDSDFIQYLTGEFVKESLNNYYE